MSFEDADTPQEILEDSSGTATVGGEVVNEDEDTDESDGVEADSDASKVGCGATKDTENSVQYDNIPDELTKLDRWVCWRVEERNDEPTKVPVDATAGGTASCDNEETWASFEKAREYHEHEATDTEGIGFMFSRDGRYAGVDLDKCVDESGTVDEWARDIAERLDSYTEYSPSGTGLHVIVEGILPPDGNRKGEVEMYDESRFFTVTGDVGVGAPKNIEKRVGALKNVHAAYIGDDNEEDEDATEGSEGARDSGSSASEPSTVDLEDEELIQKAKNAENGDFFKDLWEGNWRKHSARWTSGGKEGGSGSHSEADQALCCLLAFWTGGDRKQIDELFRRSGLMRDKWDEDRGSQTYGELTVDNALKEVDEYYEPSNDSDTVDVDEVIESVASDDTPEEDTVVGALSSWLAEYRAENEETPNKGEKTEAARRIFLEYQDFVTVREDDELWRYDADEGVWDNDGEDWIDEKLDRALGSEYSTRVGNEAVRRVKARTRIDSDEFRLPEGMVPVQNGMLDLETGTVRGFEPEDYATDTMTAPRDEEADCPRFLGYLEDVTRSGSDRKKLQEYAGYILIHGRMPHHKALFLAGPRHSGKSTFIKMIQSLLPEDMVGASTPHQLTRRFGKACLKDRWLNVSADIPSDMIEDAGTFKMLTGDDKVEAEIKRVQERIKFTPTTKHIFSANQLPEVYEADDAFWRRIIVVPFPNTVSEEDRVDELARKILDEEGAGILNWMVEGYERLVDEGGFTADRTPEETKQLWYTWSTPVIRFYARCMRDEVGGEADKATVYRAYKQFCEEEMGVMPVTDEAFGNRLTKFPHIDSDRVKTGGQNKKTVYRNVVLREDLR